MSSSSLFDLTGRKALVTGAGRGIGRACAVALAMAGADVAIVGRNDVVGRKTAAGIREMGRDSFFVGCDVSAPDQVQAMVDAVADRFGHLDIVVNNAAIWRPETDDSRCAEDWNLVIATNLTGTWLCARAAMKQMIRQQPVEGKIINVASIAASMASGNGSYDASKAGIVHLTRTLAAQWGRYNINVNCISPGYVMSAMGKTRSLEQRRQLRAFTPLGYVERVEDLYGPILFLASKASDYVTGQELVVDGGFTLSRWMAPLERVAPPRIDGASEVIGSKQDLDARGVAYDADGIVIE